MLCVWWNYEGLYIMSFCQMTNYHSSHLLPINRRLAVFQKDNARLHTARETNQKFQELEGIELLRHPV